MTSTLSPTTRLYVDGAWTTGGAGTFTALNPATGESLAEVAAADAHDVDRAVAAATRALRGAWAATPPSAKGALLHALADLSSGTPRCSPLGRRRR